MLKPMELYKLLGWIVLYVNSISIAYLKKKIYIYIYIERERVPTLCQVN